MNEVDTHTHTMIVNIGHWCCRCFHHNHHRMRSVGLWGCCWVLPPSPPAISAAITATIMSTLSECGVQGVMLGAATITTTSPHIATTITTECGVCRVLLVVAAIATNSAVISTTTH